MKIRFSKHARQKFEVLARHGVVISKKKVIQTIELPTYIDYSRIPLLIAQGDLDKNHVLRVVYKKENSELFIITFYPGRKLQYEK
jgi:hypothetical protein